MRRIVYYCELCEVEITEKNKAKPSKKIHSLMLWIMSHFLFGEGIKSEEWDVCNNCYHATRKFLKERKESNK